MSLALARAYPHLKACILDFKFVCDTASKIIRKERLSHRIKTLAGDMNKSIPRGFDTIMFWNIGYIENRVMKMVYESLPNDGMVVRSCFPASKTSLSSAFMHAYLSVRPKGQTKSSIISSLKEAGFRSVKYCRISQSLGLITGLKGKAVK